MVMGAMAFYASGDIHVPESLLAQQNVQNINTRKLCKPMFRTWRKGGNHTLIGMQRDNIERYEHSSVDYNDPVI